MTVFINRAVQGNMSKLKLYGGAKNRGRRCYWLAKELGLDIEAVEIGRASCRERVYGLV